MKSGREREAGLVKRQTAGERVRARRREDGTAEYAEYAEEESEYGTPNCNRFVPWRPTSMGRQDRTCTDCLCGRFTIRVFCVFRG